LHQSVKFASAIWSPVSMSMDETVTRTPDDQRPNRISTSATLAAQASARAGVNGGY
jgi:hypothetical protein